jgi:HEAT repeat protein
MACGLALTGLLMGCKEKAPQVNVSAAAQGLKSTDTDTKANACVELAKAGPSAASTVPDLIPLLKDKDPLVRHLAAYALGQIGPQASSAIPALKEAMNDSDHQVVSDALNALRFIGETNSNVAVPNVMTGPGEK